MGEGLTKVGQTSFCLSFNFSQLQQDCNNQSTHYSLFLTHYSKLSTQPTRRPQTQPH
jgi:hypothetical protein